MKQQSTHITLLNKHERFTFHLGDLILIAAIFVLTIIIVDVVFESEKSGMLNTLLYILIYFLYFLVFETIYASTPVKFKNAHIVDMNGAKPTFPKILIRTISRVIPFDSLSFILLKRGRGLHDVLSGTQMVKKFKKK